jgi:hypothetical protein
LWSAWPLARFQGCGNGSDALVDCRDAIAAKWDQIVVSRYLIVVLWDWIAAWRASNARKRDPIAGSRDSIVVGCARIADLRVSCGGSGGAPGNDKSAAMFRLNSPVFSCANEPRPSFKANGLFFSKYIAILKFFAGLQTIFKYVLKRLMCLTCAKCQ